MTSQSAGSVCSKNKQKKQKKRTLEVARKGIKKAQFALTIQLTNELPRRRFQEDRADRAPAREAQADADREVCCQVQVCFSAQAQGQARKH